MSNITIATICLAVFGFSVAVMFIVELIMVIRKPVIIIDGHSYVAECPKLKTIHGKTGEVVIGGFKEVQE